MKRLLLLLLSTGIVMALTSCSVSKSASYPVGQTRLNLNMENLTYLGDSHISVEYNTIIGFRHIIKINGVQYDGKKRILTYPSTATPMRNSILARALPAVYDSYPDAEFIIVSNEKHSKEVMFLGAEHLVEAKVKVYSINQ